MWWSWAPLRPARCPRGALRCGLGNALLRAVAAKARGRMCALDVSGRLGDAVRAVSAEAVAAACAANVDSLLRLDVRCGRADDPLGSWHVLTRDQVVRMLAAAPRLRRLDVGVYCTAQQAVTLLRTPALRVRRLRVHAFARAGDVAAVVARGELAAVETAVGARRRPARPPAAVGRPGRGAARAAGGSGGGRVQYVWKGGGGRRRGLAL